MPAPSLVKLATDVCIANIRSITSVGDFEYWKIRKVLMRVESPEQLHQIEQASPQIQGEDAELWQNFIARHVPNWKEKNYMPKDPKKWYLVYKRYMKEERDRLQADEDRLREAMMGIKAQKESHVSKVIDARYLPKLPRDPRMLANNGGVPIGRRKGLSNGPATSLTFSGGSRTKITDGRSLFTKVRREAKEIMSRGRLNTPTNLLAQRSSKPKQAPAGMIKEHERAAAAPVRIFASKKRSGASSSQNPTGPTLEERERRLRAMKNGSSTMSDSSKTKATVLTFDDDDDYSNNEAPDDIFEDYSVKQSVEPRETVSKNKLRPGRIPPPPRDADLVSLDSKGKAPTRISTSPDRSSRPRVLSRLSPPRPVVQKRKQPVDIFHQRPKKTRMN